jgi:hypothetical protein
MMRGLLAAIAVFCLFLAAQPSLASDEAPQTREQYRALPVRERQRQVERDLLRMFVPFEADDPSFRRGTDTTFMTRPVGTRFLGLCRRDWVTVYYERVQEAGHAEDARIKPHHIDSQPMFKFLTAPDRGLFSADRSSATLWQSVCSGAGKDSYSGWFRASDEDAAVKGALAFFSARQWLASPGHTFASCVGATLQAPALCDADLRRLLGQSEVTNLWSISQCPARPGEQCWTVDFLVFVLTVRAKEGAVPVGPDDIIEVDGAEEIIVT